MVNDFSRPDPDKLLEKIQQERKLSGRGSLKIFFGACAGVGKTYAMLEEAQAKFKEGIDVVVGLVETHSRADTASMLEGLPQIPRKKIEHRGVEILEFDLDATLARKPELLLLDELAHTNAPGSRHAKRWMDVEELLAKGIDIYTTLNVQHLESINDLVAKSSGIQVKETVPDVVFDQADHMVLVDVTTDELLHRLKCGKVYTAEIARKNAADNFFKKRNLITLRELALRRTAERVDAQISIENTSSDNSREPMLSESIVVCVGHDSLSTRIIRHAKRSASRMKAPWFAVYVETGRHYRLGEKRRDTVERNMQLAERMGATAIFLKGDNAVEEILNFAKARKVSRIVVGLRHRGWLRDILAGTLAEKLIRKSENIEINVITESSGNRNLRLLFPSLSGKPSGFFYSTIMMVLCTFVLLPLRDKVDTTNLVMIYLITVMLVASRFGAWPSIFASVLGVGAFNFFFTAPYYTFNVYDARYHFTFAVMFIASVLIGSIASRLRLQAMFYRQKEQEIRHLFLLAKVLSSTRGHENMAAAAAKYVGGALNAEVVIWLPGGAHELHAVSNVNREITIRQETVAKWAFDNGHSAGAGTNTLAATKGRYIPLKEEGIVVGVMGVIPLKEEELQTEQLTMLEAFSTIIAISVQRATKSLEAEQSKIETEAEKLRNMLLQSISHDLRTPLVSISGLSSELLEKEGLPRKVKPMIKTIHDQSSRLSRIVKNILDITSLESGKIKLNKQPYFLEEIIGSSIRQLKNILPRNCIYTDIKVKELIEVDGLLIEQVFTNLIENAVKYNTNTPLAIYIAVDDKKDHIQVSVSDNGAGLTKGEEVKIFEKFHKGIREGTGLGLPICKSVIEAHGGEIWAENRESGGARFVFTLPKVKSHTAVINREE